MTTATRPTAIGDHPVYSVTWRTAAGVQTKVHGAAGEKIRVTLCALDFIDILNPYTKADINCRVCLARIRELFRAG